VTEAEWLACDDTRDLADFLQARQRALHAVRTAEHCERRSHRPCQVLEQEECDIGLRAIT
jgi:hypothetical protein